MKTMRDIIKERQHDAEETKKQRYDFLDHLIDEMKSQSFLTYDFITYVMFALMFATMETIPATLTLAIKFMKEHPLVLQELMREHEVIMKKKEDAKCGLTWEDYKSMTFTMNVEYSEGR
ncbi:hypothetical protein SLEP1_g43343 [Rubroshorea leprosula]|uniref:Cytochrome P450 n=1 Tax=Rubroshorea leprosula TaxID=152421 RepID=A0AAV5LCP6_9ROSI|nr:hypothetical protein SLEP1_g43343 [Rubroshorea leprosula]